MGDSAQYASKSAGAAPADTPQVTVLQDKAAIAAVDRIRPQLPDWCRTQPVDLIRGDLVVTTSDPQPAATTTATDPAAAGLIGWLHFVAPASIPGAIDDAIPVLLVADTTPDAPSDPAAYSQLLAGTIGLLADYGIPGCSLLQSNPLLQAAAHDLGFRPYPVDTASDSDVLYYQLPHHYQSITVYCGSSLGHDPAYAAAADTLGQLIADQGYRLVYGGGKIGLMGRLADSVLAAGGEVHGVITSYLVDKEIAHPGLTEVEVVPTMAARKARMIELGDCYVALPGGIGTLEELTEVLTNQQLVAGAGPVVLLNIGGYWQPFLEALQHMAACGFIPARYVDAILTVDSPAAIPAALQQWRSPGTKWVAGQLRAQ
ncbi:TIGR00730 family Rossman fold protein [Corynebacterium choanae]|nr:TIGR00730 family Rossman fold protein [Corynebacterium choanae]